MIRIELYAKLINTSTNQHIKSVKKIQNTERILQLQMPRKDLKQSSIWAIIESQLMHSIIKPLVKWVTDNIRGKQHYLKQIFILQFLADQLQAITVEYDLWLISWTKKVASIYRSAER